MVSIKKEFENCDLGDTRLTKRLIFLADQMFRKIGSSIPTACENWAGTKASYRLFDNSKVTDNNILENHFERTSARLKNLKRPALILHDTSAIGYIRKNKKFGKIGIGNHIGNKRYHSFNIQGLLMHISLIVTTNGLPLGVAAAKFWTRKKFKGTEELKRHVNPTRIPIKKKKVSGGLKIFDKLIAN